MGTVSYDEQSLIVDGRRVWLVSGSVHYARVPREQWRERIRAAKQAGLNCIDTYVFWNQHEPEPGEFNFDGNLDLGAFIEIIGEEGMYCILRPGPYIGAGCDHGGLPPWLLRQSGIGLRQADGPFLEACSRYISAVLDQVVHLQVTSSNGGHILLMAAENRWFCQDTNQAQRYLLEISRYLREGGCTVPIIECNNLWSATQGAIAGWSGSQHLAGDLRQLHLVQPHAPRLLIEYETGEPTRWSVKHERNIEPWLHEYHLASVLAVGAQYNICPFHGGTNFGFMSGRTAASRSSYVTTAHDCDSPLSESGGRGLKYLATKRVSVFAGQFGQLFAHLKPDQQHTAITPSGDRHGLSVVHQHGSMGQVVFLFKHKDEKIRHAHVLLPDGTTLTVPMGDDAVAWFVLDADLGGVATLNYTNLRPWAFLNENTLVVFGPAGSDGVVCVNNTPLRVKVPKGQTPLVEQCEELTVVVLNRDQADAAYISPDGLVVGAGGLDGSDRPIAVKPWTQITTISGDGQVQRTPSKTIRLPATPKLTGWQEADVDEILSGESERFEPIDGPASLEALDCGFGYGWYRLSLKSHVAGKAMVPESADRLHVYQNNKLATILGNGPGAQDNPVNLRLGERTVILADNLGRSSDGWLHDQRKGIFGHIYDVKALKLTKPKVVQQYAPDLSVLNGFFPFTRISEQRMGDTLVWKLKPAGKGPTIIELDRLPWRAVLVVNDQVVGAYDPDLSGGFARFVLHRGEYLKVRGANTVTLAAFDKLDPKELTVSKLSKHVRIYHATASMTAKASWAFAKWSVPEDSAFRPMNKTHTPAPRWYRCQFRVTRIDAPLWVNPDGMTKGQIYLNGHNVGRYFVATHTGSDVPPQKCYYLPEPWLNRNDDNELVIFDEHGRGPEKCQLVYGDMIPRGR